MLYVLDTNSIRVLAGYYPDTFPSFWEKLNGLVASGRVISVEEVKNELDIQLRSPHLIAWVDSKDIFNPPTEDEMMRVTEIFAVPHFQQMISARALALGRPVADPWLIARAGEVGGCVVTEEADKPNAAKVPNVCAHFDLPFMNLEAMLKAEGWTF